MIQADCVLSTPPTNTSASPPQSSRRGFLVQAAGTAAGGAALGAGLPLPVTAATSQRLRDPIFAAIDMHRQAEAACIAVPRGVDIPEELGDRCGDAFRAVLRTRPTTPAGLVALTTWTREEVDQLRKNSSVLFCGRSVRPDRYDDDAARGMTGLMAAVPAAS